MGRARGLDIKPEQLATREGRSKFVVCVVGLGRMGLPTACLWARAGFRVLGVDTNPAVVEAVNSGKAPFEEPGLEGLLTQMVREGRLRALGDVREASSLADIIKILVPTPVEEGRPDYSSIRKACREVGFGLRPGALVVVESTVGPGTTEGPLREALEEASGLVAGRDFGLAYSPVRASSGSVLKDLVEYPRVLGALDKRSLEAAKAFFSTVVKGGIVEVPDIKTAEVVKLAENIYRDVVLALSNELAVFCEKAGVDYHKVVEAANTQPYCRLLRPGLVGGHLPKDPYLLIYRAEELKADVRLVRTARRVNEAMVKHVVKLVREALREGGKSLRRARIAILGVSYKPNVKNPSGTRTADLVRALGKRCKSLVVYDPFFTKQELEELGYPASQGLTDALEGADCLILAVGHGRFRDLDLRAVRELMSERPAIVDVQGILEPSRARELGFSYRGLGRGPMGQD